MSQGTLPPYTQIGFCDTWKINGDGWPESEKAPRYIFSELLISSKVLSVSSSVSVHSRRAPLAPVAVTWHTSTSAPSFCSSSSQICCFWDSRSLGPFTSTSYNNKTPPRHIARCGILHVTRLKRMRYHRVSESTHKDKNTIQRARMWCDVISPWSCCLRCSTPPDQANLHGSVCSLLTFVLLPLLRRLHPGMTRETANRVHSRVYKWLC